MCDTTTELTNMIYNQIIQLMRGPKMGLLTL